MLKYFIARKTGPALIAVLLATSCTSCSQDSTLGQFATSMSDTMTRSNFVDDCVSMEMATGVQFKNQHASMLDSLKAGTTMFSASPEEVVRLTKALSLKPVVQRDDLDVSRTSSECVNLASAFEKGSKSVNAYKVTGYPKELGLKSGRRFEYAVLLYDSKTNRCIMELGYEPLSSVDATVSAPVALASKATAGDANAQYDLGMYYADRAGNFKAYNPKVAAQWLEKAALQGNMKAQLKLGTLQGSLGSEDPKDSEKWYRMAARTGSPDAQTSLATTLLQQHHVAGILSEAKSLLQKAAAQNNCDAMYLLDVYDLESKQTIAAMYERSAKAGNKRAAFLLAQCYSAGKGMPVDLAKAEEWYRVSGNNLELAPVLMSEKKFKEACRLSKLACDAQPASAESMLPFVAHPGAIEYSKAQQSERDGKFEEAANLYEAARKERADDLNRATSF